MLRSQDGPDVPAGGLVKLTTGAEPLAAVTDGPPFIFRFAGLALLLRSLTTFFAMLAVSLPGKFPVNRRSRRRPAVRRALNLLSVLQPSCQRRRGENWPHKR